MARCRVRLVSKIELADPTARSPLAEQHTKRSRWGNIVNHASILAYEGANTIPSRGIAELHLLKDTVAMLEKQTARTIDAGRREGEMPDLRSHSEDRNRGTSP